MSDVRQLKANVSRKTRQPVVGQNKTNGTTRLLQFHYPECKCDGFLWLAGQNGAVDMSREER